MPTYLFYDAVTDIYEEEFMSISSMEKKLAENPNLELVLYPIDTIDPMALGRIKTPDSFKDLVKTIKSKHLHSTIKT